jgi:23S rRNA (adenine2030-N6)-methyltransferase
MRYRHRYHAGNFADVHKHVTLLSLIGALQRKDKGFFYLDTHAGRGLYELGGAATQPGAEAHTGIGALDGQNAHNPVINAYLATLERARSDAGSTAAYAGSPILAALTLRPQDRGLCCEILPSEFRALEHSLRRYGGMRCQCIDGYQALRAQLPPKERRALVLIDPAYEEQTDDLGEAITAAGGALSRLANAVVAVWYPIKTDREITPWLAHASGQLAAPVLAAELWLHPRDARVGLNGSGLLIVNPPYQLDLEMQQWLPELGAALGTGRQGGVSVRWISHEQPH